MDKTTARNSGKKINAELFSLGPSALMTFFEIDLTDILFDKGIIGQPDSTNEHQRIFRFHNNLHLTKSSLQWQGKTFVAIPAESEGFEYNSTGTLPQPKMRISVSEEGVPTLSLLKTTMEQVGDAVGAKFTRRRTLAKYLDAANFAGDAPDRHSEDQNAEFPRDVYFIERKSEESKTTLEFELASVLDIENIRLPARLMIAKRCMWFYRGEGCSYEYSSAVDEWAAEYGMPRSEGAASLPASAGPKATENDEKFSDLLPGVSLTGPFIFSLTRTFLTGQFVYITKDNLRYYFVAKKATVGNEVTNTEYWWADQCSKTIRGCKFRWDNINDGSLPFGGFPALGRIGQ
jgi:lambda family phage minor tail protein L